MKITMDGEYALRKDPYTPVRMLCEGRPSPYPPLAFMTDWGAIFGCYEDGTFSPNGTKNSNDLVPLQEKPREYWAVLRSKGEFWCMSVDEKTAEAKAERLSKYSTNGDTFIAVQMKPVVS